MCVVGMVVMCVRMVVTRVYVCVGMVVMCMGMVVTRVWDVFDMCVGGGGM